MVSSFSHWLESIPKFPWWIITHSAHIIIGPVTVIVLGDQLKAFKCGWHLVCRWLTPPQLGGREEVGRAWSPHRSSCGTTKQAHPAVRSLCFPIWSTYAAAVPAWEWSKWWSPPTLWPRSGFLLISNFGWKDHCPWTWFQEIVAVVQLLSCVWFWDPTDCSLPGFPVLHHLYDAIQPSLGPPESVPQTLWQDAGYHTVMLLGTSRSGLPAAGDHTATTWPWGGEWRNRKGFPLRTGLRWRCDSLTNTY